MKKAIFFLITCLTGLIIFQTKSFSQNANITYTGNNTLCNINNTPYASCCNVFNMSGNNPTVGGYKHWPLAGGAIFDGSNIILQTRVDLANNINDGTGYAIQYPFKVGFTYDVKITLFCKPSNWSPTVTVGTFENSLPNPNQTHAIYCGPVELNYYINAYGSVKGHLFIHTPGIPTTYSVPAFTVPTASNFLSIVAHDGPNMGTGVRISNVTITETPTVSFTLTPNQVTKTCGNFLSQIFTINNLSNTPGIQSYTWNLGAIPNGWYDVTGNPAPATLSTTLPTLTLTANPCDLPPKNISAAAVIGATTYLTNSVVVNAVNPSLSISDGPEALCSGAATYTIKGIPCNSNVTWSVQPSGIVSVTPNGNQVTLGFITNGNIVLTASVYLSCSSQPITINKEIPVGIPVPWNFPIFGPPSLCVNQPASYSTAFYGGVTYSWFTNGFMGGGGAGPVCGVTAPPYPGAGQIFLDVSNACGVISNMPIAFVQIFSCFKEYSISPNPTKDRVTIKLKNPGNNNSNKIGPIQKRNNVSQGLIYAVKITDYSGVVKRKTEYRTGVAEAGFSLAGMPAGMYSLSVFNGKTWENHSLMVQ